MKPLELTVTSLDDIGVYYLVGGHALTHKAASVYPDNPALNATVAALAKIPWLSMVRRISDGKSKGKRLKLMFYSDSPSLIESCHYLSTLKDPTGLPEQAKELHSLLQRFEVLRWTRIDADKTERLKQWAATVAPAGAR